MGKDINELAARDSALAALMGVTGTDFGHEAEQFGAEAASFGGYNGGPDFGDEAWDELAGESMFGLEPQFGAAPMFHPMVNPALLGVHPAALAAQHASTPQGQAIIAQHLAKQAGRNSRAMLLEPNKNSDLKVERYTFAINTTITALGTAGAISGSNSPDVNFRPQRVTANVVSPGMVTISDARVANVSFTVGGSIDAWQWNANSVGQALDVPTLTPANKATFSGSYTGLVPSPLSGTGSYAFSLAFTGPASIVA